MSEKPGSKMFFSNGSLSLPFPLDLFIATLVFPYSQEALQLLHGNDHCVRNDACHRFPVRAALSPRTTSYDDLHRASYVSEVKDRFRQVHFISGGSDDCRIKYFSLSSRYGDLTTRDLNNAPAIGRKTLPHLREIFRTNEQDSFQSQYYLPNERLPNGNRATLMPDHCASD
jgi:hypothetical protein